MELHGKRALIIGGSRGIGAAIAETFAKKGSRGLSTLAALAALAACAWQQPALAQSKVERLYVLNCGEAQVKDIS